MDQAIGGGAWQVKASNAAVADPRVRTAYAPIVTASSFCLAAGGSQVIEVAYALIPTSNKLWATNGSGGTGAVLGFSSAALASTGSAPATISANAAGGRDLAFDSDGNLWAQATTAEPALVRFTAASLATSGAKTYDRGLDITGLSCAPRISGIAFDAAGNLWVSSPCLHNVMKIPAESLAQSGAVYPAGQGHNIDAATGVAFDGAGNLWVADPTSQRLWRYDAIQLTSADIGIPSSRVGARVSDNAGDNTLLTPSWMAFDASGNLWANDFNANAIFKVEAAALSASGDVVVTPAVRIYLSVVAVLEGMAFDEGGGLWMAGSTGKIVRVSPSQLGTSSTSGSPTAPDTVITSSDIGSVGNVAFYPAPAATPLFHRLP